MSKYSIVLFDFDGTLADTDPVIFASMNILYDKYRGGRRATPTEMIKFSGPPIADTIRNEFPNMDTEKIVADFRDISNKLYETKMVPNPGMFECLAELKKLGFKLGLVSSKQRSGIIRVLDLLNIADYFDVIVGLNDVKRGKPFADPIEKALEFFNEKDKSKAVYVGDNEVDIKCCENAGIDSIIVKFTPRYNPSWEATYKIDNLLEIVEIVKNA